MAAARAEAAWLEGRTEAVADATESALELAIRRRAWWIVGELAFWRMRAGIHDEIAPIATEPWAAHIAGDWRRAAELWNAIDSPYEAALALAERLVLSEKTIDHHVSAILRKLDVRTRGEASAQAVTLGLAGQDR